MKILVVGDPHGYKNIKDIKADKDIDLILITGDLAESDLVRDAFFKAKAKGISDFRKAFSKTELNELYTRFVMSAVDVIKHFAKFNKPVYFVYGNLFGMEYSIMNKYVKDNRLDVPDFENEIKRFKNVLNIGLRKVIFKGITIAGVPYFDSLEWINEFDAKDNEKIDFAKKQEPKVKTFLTSLKKVDILLTHIPPRGYLDLVSVKFAPENWKGKNAGSSLVLKYVKNKRPKYVFCGHIHEGKGSVKVGESNVYNIGCNGDFLEIDLK